MSSLTRRVISEYNTAFGTVNDSSHALSSLEDPSYELQSGGHGRLSGARRRRHPENRNESDLRGQEGVLLRPADPRHGRHDHDPDGQRGAGRTAPSDGHEGGHVDLQDPQEPGCGDRAAAVEPAV